MKFFGVIMSGCILLKCFSRAFITFFAIITSCSHLFTSPLPAHKEGDVLRESTTPIRQAPRNKRDRHDRLFVEGSQKPTYRQAGGRGVDHVVVGTVLPFFWNVPFPRKKVKWDILSDENGWNALLCLLLCFYKISQNIAPPTPKGEFLSHYLIIVSLCLVLLFPSAGCRALPSDARQPSLPPSQMLRRLRKTMAVEKKGVLTMSSSCFSCPIPKKVWDNVSTMEVLKKAQGMTEDGIGKIGFLWYYVFSSMISSLLLIIDFSFEIKDWWIEWYMLLLPWVLLKCVFEVFL